MDTVTRTFPVNLTNSYTPDSIIELCHFRDMTFDADERVAVYLESFFCNLSLKSFNLGVIPNFDGSESEIEKMSKFNAAEAKSQKLGLRILIRKNNIGNWQERAEIILINRGRKDYFDLLQPYLAKNQVRIFEKNDALAIQLIDYGNGLLKPIDNLGIEAAFTVTIAQKKNLEAFEARMASLELAIKDRINNIPSNSLLGRDAGTGIVEIINQSKFATPQMIDQAIIDWVGTTPENLNTLKEFGNAINNDASFAATVTTALTLKPDYEEGFFSPTLVGSTTAGVGTYSTRIGSYSKIGKRVFFNLFLEWTEHTGAGFGRINGLPYLCASNNNSAVSIWHRNYTLSPNYTIQAYLGTFTTNGVTQTQILLQQIAIGGGETNSNLNLDIIAGLMISGSYLAVS